MCAIDALDGVKKKSGNAAVTNFAVNQSLKAEDKMLVYEKTKKDLMSKGMPEKEAIKFAEKAIKELAGNSANSGVKTNNDKDASVGKSRQENERVMGETNIKGEALSLVDASEDSGNNSDNSNNGRKSDTFQIADLVKQKGSIKKVSISLFGND